MSVLNLEQHGGWLHAAYSVDHREFDHVVSLVDRTSCANSEFLNILLCQLEEHYDSVGFIGSLHVDAEHRGKRIGSSLLNECLLKLKDKTQLDFLFASVAHPQRDGFSLINFYLNRGFDVVNSSNGEILMANKGQASTIRQLLDSI